MISPLRKDRDIENHVALKSVPHHILISSGPEIQDFTDDMTPYGKLPIVNLALYYYNICIIIYCGFEGMLISEDNRLWILLKYIISFKGIKHITISGVASRIGTIKAAIYMHEDLWQIYKQGIIAYHDSANEIIHERL
ncbi:MAG: hypothetical protein QY317_03155 [Candidatus Jettenia caeni]|nr:MAG: hypothetical protein QY317_03155 [Candidatus Jettenia caeni]